MATRQTSSSGRPKSPRIQVVLPEELCERLAALAEEDSRTVSNMAKVLIQQGVERHERLRQQASSEALAQSGAAPSFAQAPQASGAQASPAVPPAMAQPIPPIAADPPAIPPVDRKASGREALPGARAAADRFRAELERHQAEGTRRLRGAPRRLRLRSPGT